MIFIRDSFMLDEKSGQGGDSQQSRLCISLSEEFSRVESLCGLGFRGMQCGN